MRLLIILLFVVVAASVQAQETWPRFRGPNGAGLAPDARLPDTWTADDYAWQVDLPGKGHSSPVIAAGIVAVTAADGDILHVCCYDLATGEGRLDYSITCPPMTMHVANSTATSTPAIDDTNVYVSHATREGVFVTAVNHTPGTLKSSQVWQAKLPAFEGEHGYGASPIVVDGVVCLVNDSASEGMLVGFDAKTGKELWRVERPLSKESYSTPCVVEGPEGESLVICESTASGLQAIDVKNGNVVWTLGDLFPERTVSSPLATGDLIISTCGSGNGGQLLVAAQHDGHAAKVAFTLPRNVPYVPTPIAAGELMFLWHDQGIVTCVERETGKQLWKKRVQDNYYASPIIVGDKLLSVSRDGNAFVLAADRKFKQLGEVPLGEPSHATPAVAGGRLLLRTESKLMCLPCANAATTAAR